MNPTDIATADRVLAAQAARRARIEAITNAPAAVGKENLAFALACRSDLPAGRAIALMTEAPELLGVAEIIGWVDAIPTRPVLEVVQ